ncbi:MAG: acyl dehydratase [Polaromonas sp.]|nr:acyl dehydratase [Polaromonas sp.]
MNLESFRGLATDERHIDVEASQLKLFATAIGECNPVFTDAQAARDAGHRALPAPPTFAFCLENLAPPRRNLIAEMGIDLKRVLHAEQGFEYFKTIYAGDRVRLNSRIADIYEKKGGALTFIAQETTLHNQLGELCVKSRSVAVVRAAAAGVAS